MGSWFLNAGFLGMGTAALVSAPVIIHLINRYRFRRVEFAAMEFLLASQTRNRRRILVEQLLLLLLRILLVMGLIALIARLVLDPSTLALLQGADVHHLVLLDDTASMQDEWNETNGFDEAKGVIEGLVAASVLEGGGQRLTVLRLSRVTQPDYLEQRIDRGFQGDLKTRLDSLPCSFRHVDLADGLAAAAQLLAKQPTGVKHLHVVSDFRQHDWQDSTRLVEQIETLAGDGVTVNLVRTVPERHANLAVTELSGELQVASARVPVELTAAVANHGETLIGRVNLAVSVDGERLPLEVTFERIEAGQVVEQSFEVTFEVSGKHRVEVTLPGDSLSADNTRHLAVEVAAANRVLVIEGDPSDQEGIFPTLALAANPQASGYQTVVASSDFLYRNNIDDFQSILMLNVPELTPDAIESLEAFVRGGGGLVWYTGDAINPASYNSLLYAEGKGLFPVPLADAPRELLRDNVAAPGPDLELTAHPMLAGLQGQDNPEIEATRIFRFFPVSDEWQKDDRRREDSVTTIGRLRTRDPLLLEHRFGRGRVITCLTSCGPDWTNFPQYRSFVPFHFELQKYISRSDRVLPQRESGAPIHLELDPSRFGPAVRIEPPRNSGQVTVEMQVQAGSVQTAPAGSARGGSADAGDKAGDEAGDKTGDKTKKTGAGGVTQSDAKPTLRRVVDYDRTDYPGVYRVRLVADEVNVERWFAYNTGRDEGRLELADTTSIRKSLGPELAAGVRIQEAGSTEWLSGEESDRDIREWILGLLILVLLAEQVMAYRLSFHPSRGAA
jgi:hypothetical protein